MVNIYKISHESRVGILVNFKHLKVARLMPQLLFLNPVVFAVLLKLVLILL